MPIRITNRKDFANEARMEMAKRLAAAAIFFVTHHQQRVGVPNPSPFTNPSRPGEYPRKRTGFGQKSVIMVPTDPNEIARTLKVTVGYARAAFYMPHLEFVMARLGLQNTLNDLEPQLRAILGSKATAALSV